MTADSGRVMLVDDDASLRQILARELKRTGFDVETREDASGLQERVAADPPEAVLLDLRMPGQDGQSVLEELSAADPDLQVIVITGHGSVEDAVRAMQCGACDFLTKPIGLDLLNQTVRRAVQSARLLAENRRWRRLAATGGEDLPDLVSEPARRVDRQIQRMGRSGQGVLILGESGVGKEVAARALHAASDRSAGPFVAVNCGAIPAQLMESELFGHRKGAFTGAETRRTGLFQAADGGTLLLDEIGELPLALQPAMLRAVQFGEIRSVGSDRVEKVDLRVVAATNQDLRQMVEAGQFREDLYFRLAVLELSIPPLRDRREDIAVLVRYFFARELARADRLLSLSADAERVLVEEVDWPGNIRELRNAVVRIAVLAAGPIVGADEVRQVIAGHGCNVRSAVELPTLELRELERLALEAALRKHGGNRRLAAQELGIGLKTIYSKLNRARES